VNDHPAQAMPADVVRGDACSVTDEPTDMGPIDYLIVEFPEDRVTGEGLRILVDLVDRGTIRVLDLVFVRREPEPGDRIAVVAIADLDGDGTLDLAVFEGASSGLLAAEDLEDAATVLTAGSLAVVLIYENVWARPMVTALHRKGAQLVASGRIPATHLAPAQDVGVESSARSR
jgi:hypothetical protein